MERLRRRIEFFRQHHNNCESRYETATLERVDLDRQQTIALHQRCLQAKAKRSNKHRQPQPSGDQAGQRAPGGGGGGGGSAELGESGGTASEQSRNSTLIALQETVKRKLESAGSPLGRDQVNGFSDSFPPNKKVCLDNGTANGSPLDSKLGISDLLSSNGTHGPSADTTDGGAEPGSDFHRKEMKQEPDDILPIMPPSGGGNNSLFPDLNLNEQEWTELMEELNCSVAYEDIQDILNDGFEDRKDPLELAPTPGGGGSVGGGTGGATGSGGGQSSQGLLPPDLASVKAEYSPASAAFEQESCTGSPRVRSTSSVPPPHPNNSPVASSSASSPAVPQSQPANPPRQLQPPPNHILPPAPSVSKDLSPAQQLQHLAAQKQRAQHLHGQMQHKQPQPAAKFHNQVPHGHPPPWNQMASTSQSPLGGAFGMDKSTSPSLYPPDFNPNTQKQLLMPNKGSPKAGAGSYLPGPGGHPNMLGHSSSGPPLSHPPAAGAQAQAAMLNYNNTKPLSHFEAGPGPPQPPNTQNQNKTALLNMLRQQQIKQKNSMNFRQHLPHTQDQNTYPAPPHGPGPTSTMASAPGGNAMSSQPAANAMAGNHGNAAYMNNQVAAVLKQQQQQQMLEQQKQQQQYMRQQLMAEQEKQRQQDQQLQRHLTRPPPQYQDQPGQPANQNPFPQQPVNQFTASSQPLGSVGSMGGPAPGAQRMFSQSQSMMGMNMGQGAGPTGGVAPPPTATQADMSLASCGGRGGGAGVEVQPVLYNNMNIHPAHPTQQAGLQRQPLGPMSAAYRQNLLAQQQHLKAQPNAAMLKQQQQLASAARMPGSMQNSMGGSLPGSMPGGMQGAQSAAWQQQLANQTPSSNAGLPPNAFNNPPNAFHMQQQPRLPKMPPGAAPFGANQGGRPIGGMNPGQQMMQTNMAAAQQRALNPQSLGQPLANQQPTQQPQANQSQAVLPNLVAFGQQGNGRQGLQCNQGYQVSRTASQQQQVSFGYNVASGSFAEESELVDSLLKDQHAQEWMAELDELLASHQ
ncbi:mastermind-like protein 1 isoform X2 [Mastacembelus armatus]|nr:mastermind-like protein 1 isoform X2 [Mastacembelus armatus]